MRAPKTVSIDTPGGREIWQAGPDGGLPVQLALPPGGLPDISLHDDLPSQPFPQHLLRGALQGPVGAVAPWLQVLAAGAVLGRANWDGIVLCLQPNRAYWLHISAGEMISALVTVTPQLLAGFGADGLPDQGVMGQTQSRPEKLLSLLHGASPGVAAAALLGAELAVARPWWLGQQIIVVGKAGLADAYQNALQAQGSPVAALAQDRAWAQGVQAVLGQSLAG
jgi:2-dehydro-3-deoxygalactonokinase